LQPFYKFDPANYLVTTWTFWDGDFTGIGLRRPFLIAILLKPLTLVFSNVMANQLLGIGLGLGMAVPLYVLYSDISPPWIAAPIAGTIVLFNPYAVMLNWGYISFLGIICYYTALTTMVRMGDNTTTRDFLVLAIFCALVFFAHQITALYLVTSVATYTLLRLLRNPGAFRQYAVYPAAGVIGSLLALPVFPIYYRLATLPANDGATAPASTMLLSVVNQVHGFINHNNSAVLALGGAALFLYGIYMLRDDYQDLLIAVFAIVVPSFTILLYQAAPRMLHFLPPIIGLAIARAVYAIYREADARLSVTDVSKRVSVNPVRVVFLTALLSVMIIQGSGYVDTAESAHDHWLIVDEEQTNALEWIEENTPRDATFAASQKSIGWVIEGHTKRNVFEPQGQKSYMKRYAFEEQRQQAEIQDRIFSGHKIVQNGNVRASFMKPYDGPGNPAIAIDTGNYRTHLIMNDSESTVDIGDKTVSLQSGYKSQRTVEREGSTTVVTRYRWDEATVEKNVTIERETSTVKVAFETSDSINRLIADLEYSSSHETVEESHRSDSITVVQRNAFGTPTPIRITSETNGDDSTRYDKSSGRTKIVYTNATRSAFTIGFDLNRDLVTNPVETYRIPEQLERHDVDYVVHVEEIRNRREANHDQSTARWFYSIPYYEQVYKKNGIVIFEINRSEFQKR
jgi:hypothetical protein